MMTISECVSIALTKAKKQKKALADLFGYSQQSMSNKFARNSWTVPDLVRVADFVNGRLVLVCSDGLELPLLPASCPDKSKNQKIPAHLTVANELSIVNCSDESAINSIEDAENDMLENTHQTSEEVHYSDESKAVSESVEFTHDEAEPVHQKDESSENTVISSPAVISDQDILINHSDESKTADTVEHKQGDPVEPIHQKDEAAECAMKKAKKSALPLPGQTSLFEIYDI